MVQLSTAETDPEGTDSYRLLADHIPYSWTASPSLKGDPGGASLFTKTNDN